MKSAEEESKKKVVSRKHIDGKIVIGEPPETRPKNIPLCPIPACYSSIIAEKSYDAPPHKIGIVKTSKLPQHHLKHLEPNTIAAVPKYFGSVYRAPIIPPPRNASVPKAYVPPDADAFSDYVLLSNRTPSGRILGSHKRTYVDVSNVPVLPEEEPVGPANPAKRLDDKWSACWDDQSLAVYYYNNVTGEATWISPFM